LGYKAPVFLLKKLLASLILPPTGLVLLAFAGLAISIRRRRLGLAIVSLALAAIVVLSLRPVAYALNRSLEDAPPLSQQALDRAQAIVILGGGTYPDTPEFGGDMLNAFSLERTHYGVFLQRRSGLPILVTGGSPYGGKAEADLMKEVIERDFRGEVKWVENGSRDTSENARYSAAILGRAHIARIVLVTHAWHMARAVGYFRREGLEVIPAATGFAQRPHADPLDSMPSFEAFKDSNLAVREWIGRLAQSLGAGRAD